MTRRMLKWSKWLSVGLVSVCVVLVSLLGIVVLTNPGLKLVLWGAQKALPELHVGEAQGALLPRFTLSNVEYKSEPLNLDAKVQQFSLALNLTCFTEPSLCIDDFTVRGLDLNLPTLPPSSEPEQDPQNDEPLAAITAPVPISIGRVELSDIHANVLGNDIRWQRFITGAEFAGNQLRLKPTLWKNIQVALAPSSQDEQSSNANSQAKLSPNSPRQALVLPEVTLPLQLEIPSFVVESFTLDQKPQALKVERLKLAASAKRQSVTVKTLELTMPQVEAKLDAKATLKGSYPLALNLNAVVNDPIAKGQKLALTASGSVADLALKANLSGPASAKLNAHFQALKAEFPFELTLQDVNAQWPLVGASEYQIKQTHANIQGDLNGYQLSLNSEVNGQTIPELKAKLSGQGDDKHIDISQLSIDTLGGNLAGSVAANWANLASWQANLQLDNIQPGLQWPQAEGSISGHLKTTGQLTAQNGWQVALPELDIQGVLRDYPLNINGQLTAQDLTGQGDIELKTPKLVLAHGPNQLTAQGELDKQWRMQVAVDFPDLAKTVPDLSGQVQGNIKLTGALEQPKVGVKLDANTLNWQNQAKVAAVHLAGQIQPLPQPQGELTLAVDDAHYQDVDVSSVKLRFNGDQSQHKLSLDLLSNLVSTSLAVKGKLALEPDLVWSGELSRANIQSEQGEWVLNHATPIKYTGSTQEAFVGHHCWRQNGSSICLDKDLFAGQSGEAHLKVDHFDFDQVAMFLPPETSLKGSVDANLWAKWQAQGAPQLKATVTLPAGKVTQKMDKPVTLGWDSMAFNANLLNDKLNADWNIQMTDNGDLSGRLAIPNVKVENKQLDGHVELSSFSVKFLSPLLGPYSKLNSVLSANVDVKGPIMQPKVSGQVKVDDMLFQGDIAPLEVTSGNVLLDLKGYQAKLDAKIQTPDGELNVNGDADWRDLAAWNTKVHVFADDLKVDLPPMVKVQVQPDMTIAVTPHQAKIDGDITLPWGRITVEELPPSAVSVSKDQVLLDGQLKPIDDSDKLPFDIETNIGIHIGDDFKLSAFGLEGGLQGGLKVVQRDRGPFVTGEVNIVNGTYTSFGQDLLIKEGKVLMNGPVDQPYVAITAIRNPDTTQDDVVAGVKVTGPADEPQMTIFSDPSMPQANALSYLLRGQDIDGDSGGNTMTTALIGLSLAQSGKVVGEIGEAFGVQDLQLDTEGAGDDSQVTVSGYIMPGLQVKYGVGIFDSVGEFTVRYRLMQDLYVEAVSGLDSAVDLLYQFEFD